MLAHRVVVQPEVVGQFCDVDLDASIDQVAEDLVSRGVTERPRLNLKRTHCRRCSLLATIGTSSHPRSWPSVWAS